MDLNKINKIFFIGLGGSGVSALARIFHARGAAVSGSDAAESEITADLRREGIEVFTGQSAENISADFDLIVYSVAVPEDNPERLRVRELGLPELSYPQLLGLLIKDKYGIGVSGTNGKTTVTALLGKIFLDAELDPTIVVGSKVDYLQGNARAGNGDCLIFESDEYRRAFDNYEPKMAVLTYITEDHLDYYRDLAEIKSAFNNYLKKIPADGYIIVNNDDANSLAIVAGCPAKIITFGINAPADFSVENIRTENGRQYFNVKEKNQAGVSEISLKLPGKYNVYNALAAIAAARTSGIAWPMIIKALEDFNGVWRRFELMGKLSGVKIIVDYAHTPDAISKVIQATKEFYPGQKILTIFQPHQYSRTKNLFKGFSEAFSGADKVIIADIFYVKGREKPEDFSVSSDKLAGAIKANGVDAVSGGNLQQTEKIIRELAKDFAVILILGAGDIYELAKNLVK